METVAAAPDPLAALGLEAPSELSPAELDARQQEMGAMRRSGPPLPEGEDTGALGLEAPGEEEEPTEVEEPRTDDR